MKAGFVIGVIGLATLASGLHVLPLGRAVRPTAPPLARSRVLTTPRAVAIGPFGRQKADDAEGAKVLYDGQCMVRARLYAFFAGCPADAATRPRAPGLPHEQGAPLLF